MGIIATVTPCTHTRRIAPRVSVTKEEIAAVGGGGLIKITQPKSCDDPASLKFERLKDPTVEASKIYPFDFLWKVPLTVRKPRPSQSGMMQAVNKGTHPGKSSFLFLSMIDLNPSNMSATTLH